MNNSTLPDADTALAILRGVMGQMNFARQYTLELLDSVPRERWLEFPDGLPTNVAWQVGHLAVSQYGLLMFRVRGRRPEDLELIPGKFRKTYSRGSAPTASAESQPSTDDLLARLNRVHELAMSELEVIDPAVLLKPADMPYAAWPITLGAIMFCPLHEQIHAGQIGLLRRSLGLPPVR